MLSTLALFGKRHLTVTSSAAIQRLKCTINFIGTATDENA
jgi:hypothetical protein